MAKYLLKRLIYMIFVLIFVSIILFSIYTLTPGDRALLYIGGGEGIHPDALIRMYEQAYIELGLDRHIVVQYFMWMKNIVTLDFGRSSSYQTNVLNVIIPPMKNTVMLNITALVIVFLITIPLGIVSAVRKGRILDNVVQVVTILGFSLPQFIFCLLFISFFSVRLGWFPVSGTFTVGFEGTPFEMFRDRMRFMALPLSVFVFSSLGAYTRYVRAAMIEALRMDYIRTARAKGLREKVVIYSHAFRNSLIPIVTIVAAALGTIFGGSLVIETVFSWGGVGKYMFDALMQRDFNISFAVTLFYVLLTLCANFIMDISYSLVDPRVKTIS